MKSNKFKRLGSGFLASLMVFQAVPVHAITTDTDSSGSYYSGTYSGQATETESEYYIFGSDTDSSTNSSTDHETESSSGAGTDSSSGSETDSSSGSDSSSGAETDSSSELETESSSETETESSSSDLLLGGAGFDHPEGTVPAMEVGTWVDNSRVFDFGSFNGNNVTWRVLEVTEEGWAFLLTHDVLDAGLVSHMSAEFTTVNGVVYETFLLEEEQLANPEYFAEVADRAASEAFWIADGRAVDANGEIVEATEAGVRLAMYVDLNSGSFDGVEYSIYEPEEPEHTGFGVEVSSWSSGIEGVGYLGVDDGLGLSHRDDYNEALQARFSQQQTMSPHSRMLAQVSSDFHRFGATRSAVNIDINNGATAIFGDIEIARVEVTVGGSYQARYRDHVGGRRVYPSEYVSLTGDPITGYFTTARHASLTDHNRRFTLYTTLTPAQVGDAATFADRVDYQYGGLDFGEWHGGASFNQAGAGQLLISLFSHRLVAYPNDVAPTSFTLETVLEFRSPAPLPAAGRPNVPFTGFRDPNQGALNSPLIMRHVIGNFDLTVHADGNALAGIPIRLTPYDDFRTWDEVDAWALSLQAGNIPNYNGVYVNTEVVGTSHRGRNIWNIIIAENRAAVDHYLNATRPMMSTLDGVLSLQSQMDAGNPQGHRMPIYMMNIHPDEFAGIDSQLIMMERLLQEEYLIFTRANGVNTVLNTWPSTAFGGNPQGHSHAGSNHFLRDNSAGFEEVRIPVEEALEMFIFIFVPTNSPDGRHYMRRGIYPGFDTNRDASFQIHEETRAVTTTVARWSPLAILDFHGHVPGLLIEPTTGPHNLNNEYDLLLPAMLEAAHAMGAAALGGSPNRYMIPLQTLSDDWDDAGPMYLPVFLTLFGVKGFTLEFTGINQCSVDQSIAMAWGYVEFAMEHFEDLVWNKLEIKRRGLSGEDNRAVDPWFADRRRTNATGGAGNLVTAASARAAAEASFTAMSNPLDTIPAGSFRHVDLGRQPGRDASGVDQFFPDFWVIPVEDSIQFNAREAWYMAGKLANHGVAIRRTTSEITHASTTYPVGTLVVDMRQAYRGYINSMMAPAANPHMYSGVYAEIEVQFPAARGFRADALWSPNLFTTANTVAVTDIVTGVNVTLPTAQIPAGDSSHLVIRNNSIDAIRLVNALLDAGIRVDIKTVSSADGFATDFIVARGDLTPARLNGLYIELGTADGIPVTAEQAVRPRIALFANNHNMSNPTMSGQGLHPQGSPASFPMGDMGFDWEFVTTAAAVANGNFNIIVVQGTSAAATTAAIDNNLPIIYFMGGGNDNDLNVLFAGRGLVAGANAAGGGVAGTFYADFGTDTILASHFQNHDTLYIRGARHWATLPSGTASLFNVRAGDREDIFQGGFVPAATQTAMLGRHFGFTGTANQGIDVTVFGLNPISRSHTRMYYPMFGAAVFNHTAGVVDVTLPARTITIDPTGGELPENTATTVLTNINGRLNVELLPTPTKFNHRFDGWFTEEVDGDIVTASTFFDADDTIFANWTRIAFEITFNSTGGSEVDEMNTNEDFQLKELPEEPTRVGFHFAGWFTEEDGEGDEITLSTIFDEDAEIFAHWIEIFTITFNTGYAGITAPALPTDRDGQIILPVLTGRAGYIHMGWSLTVDGVAIPADHVFTVSGPLYAIWEEVTGFVVTFFAEVGATAHAVMPTNDDDMLDALPTNPERAGHSFMGWFGIVVAGGERVQITLDTVFEQDATVYAEWVPETPGNTTVPPTSPAVTTAPGTPGATTTPEAPGTTTAPEVPGNTTAPGTPGNTTAPEVPGTTAAPETPGNTTAPQQPPAGGGGGGGARPTRPTTPTGTQAPPAVTTPALPGLPPQDNQNEVQSQLNREGTIANVVVTAPAGVHEVNLYAGTVRDIADANANLNVVMGIVEVIIQPELAIELVEGVADDIVIRITKPGQIVADNSNVVARFETSITIGGEEIVAAPDNFTVTVDLNTANLGDVNPHRIIAVHEGQPILGEFDPETGVFTFETNVTGSFEVYYAEDLNRLIMQIGNYNVVDLGQDIIHLMDVAPTIDNDRTLVPVRFIAEALGANVGWNAANATATISLDGVTTSLTIGQLAPGMDVPAQIIDGRTMVPLRFVAVTLGATVNWNPETAVIEVIRF